MAVQVEVADDGKHITIATEWRYKELCKSLPGATWDAKAQTWKVPLGWTTCLALRSTFRNDLIIGPKLTEWASNERVSRIDPANALRDIEAIEGNDDLFPHQRAGVQFLATARRALLADEPGLGKTAQAIRALAEIQSRGTPVFPALVVCLTLSRKTGSVSLSAGGQV